MADFQIVAKPCKGSAAYCFVKPIESSRALIANAPANSIGERELERTRGENEKTA